MSVGEWIFNSQQSLDPGMFMLCRAAPWPADRVVHWHVRPAAGTTDGVLAIGGVAVEAIPDGTLAYNIAVCNVGSNTASFQVYYEEREVLVEIASPENIPLPWDTRLASQNDRGFSLTPPGGDNELRALGVTLEQYQLLTIANVFQKVGTDTVNSLIEEVGLPATLGFLLPGD